MSGWLLLPIWIVLVSAYIAFILRRNRVHLRLKVCMDGKFTEGVDKMQVTLPDNKKVEVTVVAVDAKGNPATLDGTPTWNVSDPALLQVTPAEDGLSAEVSAVGPLGTAQVTIQADAALGDEVRMVSAVLDFTVIGSEAATFNASVGPLEDQ